MNKLFLLLLLISNLVTGENLYNYEILRIIDGDTIEIEANFLPKPLEPKISLRIKDIDTPEKRTKNKCEKILGEQASLFTEKKINEGQTKVIKIIGMDNFGRILGDVIIDGVSLKSMLLKSGIGRKWKKGDEKISWC